MCIVTYFCSYILCVSSNIRVSVSKYTFLNRSLRLLIPDPCSIPRAALFHQVPYYYCNIIVVIITWPSEKLNKKNNSDITVSWVSDSFKWVNFMQNLEHDVTVSYMMSQLASNEIQESVFCCFLFAVFK